VIEILVPVLAVAVGVAAFLGRPTPPPRPPTDAERLWLFVLDQELEVQRAIAREKVRRAFANAYVVVDDATPATPETFAVVVRGHQAAAKDRAVLDAHTTTLADRGELA
jgi:hypothetical protein